MNVNILSSTQASIIELEFRVQPNNHSSAQVLLLVHQIKLTCLAFRGLK